MFILISPEEVLIVLFDTVAFVATRSTEPLGGEGDTVAFGEEGTTVAFGEGGTRLWRIGVMAVMLE